MNRAIKTSFSCFCVRLVICALLTGALSACTLTYLPPLREARALEPRLELSPESGLNVPDSAVSRGLELTIMLRTIPESDWLAVQWFSPRNDEVAATSLWLEPDTTRELRTALPSDVTLTDGLWRAVVSYQGRLIRQFSLEVGGS